MHIIIAIVGLLGAGAFWWYRLKYMGQAANEVVDKIGSVRGSIKRKKLRKQASLSPLTAVDDPVIAAATLVIAIAADDMPLGEAREAALREAIAGISSPAKADEALIYGKWAADQIDDTVVVIDKLSPMLRDRLDDGEKEELLDMVAAVLSVDSGNRPPLAAQRIRRLRQKLGLETN